jgi:hypothetical protein
MNKFFISLCLICLVLISCGRRHELDFFFRMNDSLINCNKALTEKNDGIYAQFDKQKVLDSTRILTYWQKAQTAKKTTMELTSYIEAVKAEVIARESGITVDQAKAISMQKIHKLRKYEESTRYLIGSAPDGSAGAAHSLKNKIEKFKEIMLSLVDSSNRPRVETEFGLNTKGPYYDANNTLQTWEQYNFYQTLLAADIVILSKLISEVKSAEGKVILQLYSETAVRE